MEPAAATGATEQAAPPGGRSHRRVRNLLLDTGLQLRLASYLMAVAAALSAGLGWLLWQAWQETSRVIALADPDAAGSIGQALAAEDRQRILMVSAALAGTLLCLLGAAVVFTHRIAGPAFAIRRTCREVGQGRLSPPRPLRTRDLLVELASEVATMVEALRDREARERDELVLAARALRDEAGGAASRSAAAESLERLAAEKHGRLGP